MVHTGSHAASAAASLVVRLVAHAVGELVGPSRCAACARPTARGLALPPVFCGPCAASVDRIAVAPLTDLAQGTEAPPLRAFATYSGAMAEAIRRYKYGGHVELARPLGDLLRSAARAADPQVSLVVPVPLHPRRLAERGYDQVALLSVAVARELGARHAVRALRRRRHTPRQAELDRAARRANVDEAFEAARPLPGQRVLLVDDVATTGATLAACEAALRRAGAVTAGALVLARTPEAGVEPE